MPLQQPMKTIIKHCAPVILALGLCVSSAQAKGKGTPKKTNPVDAYMKAHDKDKNGTIEPTEFPGARAEFDKWDKNKDGKLDRTEVTAMLGKK